jgi:hypothetical protein
MYFVAASQLQPAQCTGVRGSMDLVSGPVPVPVPVLVPVLVPAPAPALVPACFAPSGI